MQFARPTSLRPARAHERFLAGLWALLGGRLRLLEVQPAGGRAMSAAELRRGRPAFAGATVLTGAVA